MMHLILEIISWYRLDNVHIYKPKKYITLLLMYPHFKRFDSVESFEWRAYNLHAKIIKYIQASNERYKILSWFI